MFAQITIYAGKQVDALVIPSEAVIRSGAKSQVFVVRGAGKFEPRLITTGLASSNEIAVLEGLKEGEEVVTSAQFLIDSESKLREATSKMLEPSTPQQPEPSRLLMEQEEHQHD
jgi:Cu(I)/Ag(I) efflux system membrane fusion protein